MKKIVVLFLMISTGLFAQDFKKDSAALAQKLMLIKLSNQLSQEESKLKDEKDAKEKTEAEAARVKKLEEQTALLKTLSDKKPEALKGSITFSESKNGSAETQALIHRSLEEIGSKINGSWSKMDAFKNQSNIIFYNKKYYEAIPAYYSLLDELDNLITMYDNLIGVIKNPGAFGVAPAIAAGSASIEAIAGLLTLFRTDVEIGISDQVLNESMLISKFFQTNKISTITFYYPEVYPLLRSGNSPLLDKLRTLGDKQNVLKVELAAYQRGAIQSLEGEIGTKEKLISQLEEKIKKETVAAAKEPLVAEKDKLIGDIKTLKDNALFKTREGFKSSQSYLDDLFQKLYTNLISVKETNPSLFQKLTELEGLVEKIKAGAYTLKLSGEAKGTNKVTKFLWGTTLKHSAFVELKYQLVDNGSKMIDAGSLFEFSPFVKSKNIFSNKN